MTSFLTRCTTPNGSTADLPLPFFTPTTALPIPFIGLWSPSPQRSGPSLRSASYFFRFL